MLIRNIIALAKMCAENPDNVDISLFEELKEYGYVDKNGNLTEYGKKIIRDFFEL